ncbi:ewing's tumor-associated antigen 1 homolog [Anoplopoma fimbria]|uniref:ewing's tumor-associated antigen 1 homolog n=1 Tax=Anoplopoma fimbria TaxID=229290 RepID=UPI0023EC3CDB|nr:ewing's tumor-associated antigen 1 homolog [Anoplopoma fimbria]
MCRDLQSPKHQGYSRYAGLNNGDSPGDVEPTQDIFWDPTSPTGSGLRNTRVVEISDIVNRLAPKDVKRKGTDSPLLQWIGDSAVPCTPDVPKPRVRKKSSRQSSVDDLVKLARQFDENMQQDRETSEQLNAVSDNLNECVNTPETKPTDASIPSDVKDLKCPSSSDPVEAELRALFDCSTQKVSGRLSQFSSASARSQEVKHQPLTPTSAESRQTELKSAGGSGLASHPADGKASCGFSANTCDDFDDDWENDDLINDSFVLAMTNNETTSQTNIKTSTSQFTSVCKPSANSAHQPPSLHSKSSCSSLQELCPKLKTSNRSTFKLEPNPHFKTKEVSKSIVAVTQPSSKTSDHKAASTKTPSIPIPDKIPKHQKTSVAADTSDSLWDDGVDDDLLYQVCDRVERISNSQPQRESPSSCREKQDGPRKNPPPPPVEASRLVNGGADRRSSCTFIRSNSLPVSCSRETGNYQGWNVPMKGANNRSEMSQSLPGSRVSLGTFNQCKDSSGTFQSNVDTKPHAVNYKSHQPAFKRNLSDSAAISSKVFVTSQMTLKCSAAEIGRKKEEALARRRLRMQNNTKP